MKTTLETIDRAGMIDAILARSRKPCPEIADIRYLLCTDGEYRSAWGIPVSAPPVLPHVVKTVGFAYRGKDGCTYGTRAQSRQELVGRWEAREQDNADEFRGQLNSMTDERIQSQFDCWCK